ncbi:MAG TPA: hypothetical protein VF623_14625 [Segetibacter sp.]|jgi:phosphotransferase system  glucose/maltose/N-acetylglucosamine-specific IIC component
MKALMIAVFVFVVSSVSAQTTVAPQPIEEQYHISYWWWILGVLVALGVGIAIYMLIKKDPRKDVVR